MDALSTILTCLLCTTPTTDALPSVARWEPIIAAASMRFGVPPVWIARVMDQESGGQALLNGKPIRSSAGAMGLMQIMPQTYAGLRQRYGFGSDPYDAHDNIFAGTAYLHELYVRYGYPNLFAAYQAGPSRVDDYLARRRPLPKVTTVYVAALTGEKTPQFAAANTGANASSNTLFFVNRARGTSQDSLQTPSSLFVTLTSTPR